VDDELFKTLMRFHREVVQPEIEEFRAEVRSRFDGMVTRDELLGYLDDIYKRFERLESEYQALSAAVRRIEESMAAVDKKLDRMALRSELIELKEQALQLTQRIDAIEKALN
jgi:predicted  nucleic acid-binding Zn-ribbon protein